MTIRVIDVETTSADPALAHVVEIGSIDLIKDGSFWNLLETLVDPGVPIPPETSAVHHIIDADVRGKKPLAEVIHMFRGATAYVAHNAAYERTILDEALGNPTWICTMKCAHKLWEMEAPSLSNQALRYWLGIINPLDVDRKTLNPHRAISDCIVTGAIFLEISKKMTFKEMVDATNNPMLFTVCKFGKYKGEKFADVAQKDPAYLRWIVDKSDMSADIKFSAKHWLG